LVALPGEAVSRAIGLVEPAGRPKAVLATALLDELSRQAQSGGPGLPGERLRGRAGTLRATVRRKN
jgi:hypothetical protein